MNTHSLGGRTHLVVLLLVTVALALLGVHAPVTAMEETEPFVAQRARIDLTAFEDLTTPSPALGASDSIGPGSVLIITIPGAGLLGGDGRFGCTANFVWKGDSTLYLGAAGHCFLPADKKATHGSGADYDASGVRVQVCVKDCDGNFTTAQIAGQLVTLGEVVYARQTNAAGDDIGHDFGVVAIPNEFQGHVRYAIPVFGGPTSVEDKADQGELGCHYGNGNAVGETFLTKGRVGMFGGSDDGFWMGDFVAAFGDSGSAIVSCEQDSSLKFVGGGAVGVITHLGASVCPCDVKFKRLKVKANHGVIFGTTVERAVEMAREAELTLEVGFPPVP